MEIKCSVVPPGGGETDFSFTLKAPGVPLPGDYVLRASDDGDDPGFAAFIVRRRWFVANSPEHLSVEVEYAEIDSSTKKHKAACERMRNSELPLQRIEWSAY